VSLRTSPGASDARTQGLRGLQDRVAALGASLSGEGVPGASTRVGAEIPLP
jgi:signal transduction histidine kinase